MGPDDRAAQGWRTGPTERPQCPPLPRQHRGRALPAPYPLSSRLTPCCASDLSLCGPPFAAVFHLPGTKRPLCWDPGDSWDTGLSMLKLDGPSQTRPVGHLHAAFIISLVHVFNCSTDTFQKSIPDGSPPGEGAVPKRCGGPAGKCPVLSSSLLSKLISTGGRALLGSLLV